MIKLFEEYNEYYQEITYSEYISYLIYHSFTESEVKILEELDFNAPLRPDQDASGKKWRLIMKIPSGTISMFKLPDEWYLAKILGISQPGPGIYNYYYKCDQIGGLIELIKDNLNL